MWYTWHMKIQYVSDLHNEQQEWYPTKPSLDTVLVVAGDIDVEGRAGNWLVKIAPYYKAVVAVLGNHDSWYNDKQQSTQRVRNRIADTKNIHLLDGNSVVIDNVRFIGATLWTSIPPHAQMAIQQTIKDFEHMSVHHGEGRLYAGLVNDWHEHDRRAIETELAKPFSGKTIVVSHHAPLSQSTDDRYLQNKNSQILNHAYHSNLQSIFDRYEFHAWIHGHTHHSFDYDLYGIKVLCNPRGYWPNLLNKDFKPDAILESDLLTGPVLESDNSFNP